MKRTILLFALILVYCLNADSQEKKRKRFYSSIETERTFMLNKWFDNATYNDPMQSLSSFGLYYRLDWRIHDNWGIFATFGPDFPDRIRAIPSDMNLFSEINMGNYYIKDVEKIDKDNDLDKSSPKGMLGAFYKREVDKWVFTPSLGIGFESIGAPRLSYTLKEKDTNEAYDIRYSWFGHRKGSRYNPLMFLSFRMKAERKIFRKLSLSLGVSYGQFLARPDFTAGMYDYYDQSLIKEIRQKGKFASTFGLSLGIGFW